MRFQAQLASQQYTLNSFEAKEPRVDTIGPSAESRRDLQPVRLAALERKVRRIPSAR